MRFSYRLLLIACVSACAPMLPEPPLPAPSPSPQTGGTVPETQPAPTPTAPPLAAYDQQGFEGWRQGFLAHKGGARRALGYRLMFGSSGLILTNVGLIGVLLIFWLKTA